jgi:hypothetical protein
MGHSLKLTSILIAAFACGCSSSSSSATSSKDAGKAAPSLDGGKPAGKGTKGGTGSTSPSSGSGTAGAATTGSSAKQAVASDGGTNPCADVPDGRAVCGSTTELYLCTGQQLYVVDCNAVSQGAGYGAGACYQTDSVTDCFGCTTGDQGTVCCAAPQGNQALCCDDSSSCALVSP